MTEIAIRQDDNSGSLAQWAEDARLAAQLAVSLAKTSAAGAFKGNRDEIAAAILAGRELGLAPIVALRSFHMVQGQPTLSANAMRALMLREGHQIQLIESSPTLCRMRGRRKGDDEWQDVVWTIDRAAQMGLTGRDGWKKQPQSMLVARATSELCRLIAADVIHAMPYSAEEVADTEPQAPARVRVTAASILATTPDEPEPQEAAQAPVDTVQGELADDYDPTVEPGWDA